MASERVDKFAISALVITLAFIVDNGLQCRRKHEPCAPDLSVVVPPRAGNDAAIRGKCHMVDGFLVSQQSCDRFCTLRGIPEVHSKIILCIIKGQKSEADTKVCLLYELTEAETSRSAICPWNLAAFSKRSFAFFRLSSSLLGVGW